MTIAPLAVTIHRGASQVGGTCIELTSAGRRIVLDIGRPLDDAEVLIPPVAGLVGTRDPSLEGVVITHGHADHHGLAGAISPEVPLIMGEATERILREAAFFLRDRFAPRASAHLRDRVPLTIGPFTITPYLVDHSAFDAYALLVEAGWSPAVLHRRPARPRTKGRRIPTARRRAPEVRQRGAHGGHARRPFRRRWWRRVRGSRRGAGYGDVRPDAGRGPSLLLGPEHRQAREPLPRSAAQRAPVRSRPLRRGRRRGHRKSEDPSAGLAAGSCLRAAQPTAAGEARAGSSPAQQTSTHQAREGAVSTWIHRSAAQDRAGAAFWARSGLPGPRRVRGG